MPCPFYGRHAAQLIRTLVPSGGNQCALITEGYAPCRMETAGHAPDLEKCELSGSGRAIEFATFTTKLLAPVPDFYPD